MATSPSHALGQIAGYMMEQAFYDMLLPIAYEFDLYVDRQGPRPARGQKKKVTWVDVQQNKHDLDFVLERGGTQEIIGTPVAFIESACRRYTKHSVNKAGEITNALIPLRRTYHFANPFLGALVAGEWTQGGISQMESQGIDVLHFPMELLVDSFRVENIDFWFDEKTSADHMAAQVKRWASIGDAGQQNVILSLRENAENQFSNFAGRLREHLSRKIDSIFILPLYGVNYVAQNLDEALGFLARMKNSKGMPDDLKFTRVEIQIRYSNSTNINASFNSYMEAIAWLRQNYM